MLKDFLLIRNSFLIVKQDKQMSDRDIAFAVILNWAALITRWAMLNYRPRKRVESRRCHDNRQFSDGFHEMEWLKSVSAVTDRLRANIFWHEAWHHPNVNNPATATSSYSFALQRIHISYTYFNVTAQFFDESFLK